MDMTEDNDLLLKQFFSEAAQQTIDDNGFTERVMQSLPQTSHGLSLTSRLLSLTSTRTFTRLWTLFCIVVFAVLFVVFRGWELLAVHFEVMLRTLAVQSFSLNLPMIVIILFSLLFVGVGEVVISEKS